jgi:hypothetical protein
MPAFPSILEPVPPQFLRDAALLKHESAFFDRLRIYWRPQVRILMVTDGSGSFNHTDAFGLGRAIDIMKADPWYWVRFVITTAHRGYPLDEDAYPGLTLHKNFNFAAPPAGLELDKFDEIWLFGVQSEGFNQLGAPEIAALTAYMNAGGGVFATGDHSTLGASLCGDLPRVNKMRKWRNAGPAGMPPPQSGPNRHDTLRIGMTPGYQFDDQSDGTPQPIHPKRYYDPFNFVAFRQRWRPHPVLCGRDGIIDVLPDHMHEGEIVVPAALDPAEFPGGVAPEVIATAAVLSHQTPPSDFSFSTPKEFGVLGAYNGHLASVGRIVVDATWHHWFNINLVGFADGDAGYEKIKNYFWNVGLWLAPTGKQTEMFNAAVYGLPYVFPFRETILHEVDLVWLGFSGVDAIGRRASQCIATEWVITHLDPKIHELLRYRPLPPNPPDPPFDAFEFVREFALGGALREVMARVNPQDPPREPLAPKEVAALVKKGAAQGLAELYKYHAERRRRGDEALHLLRESIAEK